MKKKIALITGVNGQDGAYLARYLIDKGYHVLGTVRSLNSNYSRLEYMNVLSEIKIIECNLLESGSLDRLLKKHSDISEIYNLAAISFVHTTFDQPYLTFETNSLPLITMLELIRYKYKHIKLYQASTSEIYGNNGIKVMDEESLKLPVSPYAISKLTSFQLIRMYREAYGIFCCNGILFNHESPLRGELFVTKKITKSLARYALGLNRENKIGNIFSKRDWGYAGDFVEGMHMILQHKKPDDYVLATNKTHTIKDFIDISLDHLKIRFKWIGDNDKNMKCIDTKNNKVIFRTHKDFYRPLDLTYLKGNYSKAKKVLGWRPKTNLNNLIKKMIEFDLVNEKKTIVKKNY